ncbi:MAG: sporulation protein [Oscillospiraceae bacterium]|nr:sporulation protein [Oscillospiraceae bacterium]
MQKSSRPRRRGLWAAAAFLLWAALLLILRPQESAEAARQGLALCGQVIIPSLFPFFVLSSLVVSLGFTKTLGKALEGLMRPLFRLSGPCASALVLGLVGGYPVGARTAAELYQSGQCSKEETERLLAFCNNCGPAFIFGMVGAGLFGNPLTGVLLWVVHAASALCVGLLFRFRGAPDEAARSHPASGAAPARFSAAFPEAVKSALTSTLNICAFVVFFTVILRLLAASGIVPLLSKLLAALFAPLGATEAWAQGVLGGILEVSTGVTSLTDGPLALRLMTAAFLLGWGGLSVHCQALSFTGPCGLSSRTYFTGKLLQGLLSAGGVLLLFRFLPQTAASVFAPAASAAGLPSLPGVLTISLTASLALILFFFLPGLFSKKKEWKKARKRCIMRKIRRR